MKNARRGPVYEVLRLAALLMFSAAACGEGAWVFDAGADGGPGTLQNAGMCKKTSIDEQVYLDIEAERDPYAANAYQLEFPASVFSGGGERTLEILFYDKGAGVIQPSLEVGGVAAGLGRQQSFTRLNTLRPRSAFFAVRTADGIPSGATARLTIAGLQYLRGVRLHEAFSDLRWDEVMASVPKDVAPMVALERPMDLVTTANISAKTAAPDVAQELRSLHEYVPLAKVLGFNAIELYVRWNLIEPDREGAFDFSYYDALVAKMQEYGMQWFPLLIVGSAYALPEWFIDGKESVGFVCLEHGTENLIQSIWSPYHRRHVTRVLEAFGAHYDAGGTLRGVRLGPSGNFGESQYPAGGNWAAEGRSMHIHIGYWAGDPYALADFRRAMAELYGNIDRLNAAWDAAFASFDEIPIVLPVTIESKRRRADFSQWYTHAMSDWCAWWAGEAARALPRTKIYQSAGGWGFLEAGTSYTEQAQAMLPIHGGIRLTNETDSFEQNFYVTRLAATAARLYGIDLGYEPASSHTARGVAGRIFNTATTNGDHLFTYHGNVFYQPMAIPQWLQYLDVLDLRQDPLVEIAVYYPETMNQLDDGTFRHLYAGGFYPRAAAIRRVIDLDYLDEKLIREGFLDRYKALVFVWGDTIEKDVEDTIDQWMARGGTVFYPSFPRGPLSTVEENTSTYRRWAAGETGRGAFQRFKGDMEPPSLYAEFVAERLRAMEQMHPWTRDVLGVALPPYVYLSIQQDGHVLALNYDDKPHTLTFPSGATAEVPAYGIARFPLGPPH